MALTRKMLEAMGIEGDKVELIITAHTETVDALKEQRDTYKAEAEKVPGLQTELDGFKNGDDYKEKYETLKAQVDGAKAQADKEKAAREYFRSKGILRRDGGLRKTGQKSTDRRSRVRREGVFTNCLPAIRLTSLGLPRYNLTALEMRRKVNPWQHLNKSE